MQKKSHTLDAPGGRRINLCRNFLRACSRASWKGYVEGATCKAIYDPAQLDVGVDCVDATCPVCNIHLPHTSLGGHLSIVHSWRNPSRAYAPGTLCRGCMRNFNTRPNLIKHLSYSSPNCLKLIMRHYPPMQLDEICKLDASDLVATKALKALGRKPTYTGVPLVRHLGPLLSSE